MRAVKLYGARDVRVEDVPMSTIREDSDAIIKLAAACVCGSDLWAYRGIDPITEPITVGHEYCGVVTEVGRNVQNVKVGDFVVGSFFASCGASHGSTTALFTRSPSSSYQPGIYTS